MKQDSKQLMLFIALSVGILVVWGYLFPPPKPPKKPNNRAISSNRQARSKTQGKTVARTAKRRPSVARVAGHPTTRRASATSQPAASRPTSKVAVRAAAHPVVRAAAKAKALAELPKPSNKTLSFKGKLFVATAIAHGGAISQWKLAAFRDMKAKPKKGQKRVPLDLISKLLKRHPPFTERLLDKRLLPHEVIPYQQATQPKPNIFRFVGKIPSAQGGYVEIEKRYIFDPKRYFFRIELKLTNRTSHDLKGQIALRLQDQEDPKHLKAGGIFSPQAEHFQMLCRKPSEAKPVRVDYLKLSKKAQEQLKKQPTLAPVSYFAKRVISGEVAYMAIDRRYFVMAALPRWANGDRSMGCFFQANIMGHVIAELHNAGVTVEKGKSQTIKFDAFYGPKYYETLKQAGAGLETTIEFGIFAFLSKPMLWTMQFFYNMLKKVNISNWGLAIILLTLLVKLLMWPLTHKSMESMKKMQRLKPEMDRLKEKYGDDKETIQRETMNLYVKHGINPLASCLPMLLQMPIWIALYQTILYSVELYQAPFIPGWIEDLSAQDPFYVLPVLLGISMILQHKLTPQTMDNAQAKIMGWMMPIFFTVIMLFLPAGLTLYIFVNTVLGIAHQWHIYQQPDKDEPPKKENTRKSWMQRMQSYVEEQQKMQQRKK